MITNAVAQTRANKAATRAATIEQIDEFAAAAKPYSRIPYFVADNSTSYNGLDITLHHARGAERSKLVRCVNRVRGLANSGMADLLQLRLGTKTFYLIQWRKTACPLRPDVALPFLMN